MAIGVVYAIQLTRKFGKHEKFSSHFSYLVKDYVFRYLPLITILTAISILVSSLFLIYEDNFSIEAVVYDVVDYVLGVF